MVKEEDEENEQEPVELETSRSGRVRKKPKFRCVIHRQYTQPLLADFLYDFLLYFHKIPTRSLPRGQINDPSSKITLFYFVPPSNSLISVSDP